MEPTTARNAETKAETKAAAPAKAPTKARKAPTKAAPAKTGRKAPTKATKATKTAPAKAAPTPATGPRLTGPTKERTALAKTVWNLRKSGAKWNEISAKTGKSEPTLAKLRKDVRAGVFAKVSPVSARVPSNAF